MADEGGPAGAAGASTATVVAEPSAPPAGTDAPSGATATQSEQQSPADIWAQVANLDPDELVKKHPRLAGRLGTMSQKQAERLAAQQVEAYRQQEAARFAAEQLQRDAQERIRLAREDPDKLAERVLAEEARSAEASREHDTWRRYEDETRTRLQAQIDAVREQPIFKEVAEHGTEVQQKALDYRQYRDFTAYVTGVAEAVADYRAAKKADELAKARLEALQADSKTQQFRREGANGADLGLGGGPPGVRDFTPEEVANFTPDEWRKYKAHVLAQAEAGRYG